MMSKLQWDRRSDDVVSSDPKVLTKDRRASETTHGGDFFLWAHEQALALSEGRWDALDVANLVDEVQDLGRSQKREISSRTTVLLQHLLKWKFQPKGRSSSWRGTIREQRRALNEELDDSPSLAKADIWPCSHDLKIPKRGASTTAPRSLPSTRPSMICCATR